MRENWEHWCKHCGHAIAPVNYGATGFVHWATGRVSCTPNTYDEMTESDYAANGGTFAELKKEFGGDVFAEWLYDTAHITPDDEDGSSTEGPYWLGRYGRHVLIKHPSGRVERVSLGPSDAGPAAHDETWEQLRGEMLGDWYDDWYDHDYNYNDDVTLWCELHDRPHVMGGLTCEALLAETLAGTE